MRALLSLNSSKEERVCGTRCETVNLAKHRAAGVAAAMQTVLTIPDLCSARCLSEDDARTAIFPPSHISDFHLVSGCDSSSSNLLPPSYVAS